MDQRKGSPSDSARPPKGAAAKPRRLAIFKQINCLFEARVGSGAPAACNPTTIKAPSKEEVLRRPSVDRLRRLASDRAIALAPLPKLRIAPSEVGLTGLDSYFWLDEIPTTIEAVAEVPGLRVIAQARPIEYRWSFGEGRASTTTHIGRRWTGRRPGSISHRYETKGTYLLSIEVVWEARWRSGGGPWSRLGFFTNRATRTYTVREAFGVLVKPE